MEKVNLRVEYIKSDIGINISIADAGNFIEQRRCLIWNDLNHRIYMYVINGIWY